ncbi:hypothetical protein NVV94_14140 [Pseudomonas sp. LS1212]|uniref:hypothetical protein n=1 Tax=Pseudomonas sp. LS1212 TaxID=2972478 RepID=UPI00215CE26B|nr:hypothetical protein [Pseudomonas sp. LS1212]UVJ41855.1 hypothetical protein NVV94_14140 [Pseudomonas sp. LS1212]
MNPSREKGLSFGQVTAGVKPVAFVTGFLRLFQRMGHLLSLVEQAGDTDIGCLHRHAQGEGEM